MEDTTLSAFTHLQVHSHFTLLGGTASVHELVKQAVVDGLKALALTDTAVLYGAVTFAKACQAENIKPIIGMTVPLAAPVEEMRLPPDAPGHLVLLATGPEGYRSLCRLSSFIQGGPAREELIRRGLDWEALKAHRDGVICLEGGYRGWLARYARAGNHQAATRYAARLGGIYGENCYLGLEVHQAADTAVAREITTIGERFGLFPVAMQPVYCLQPGEVSTLQLLAAIDHNCRLEDVPAAALPGLGVTAVSLHWQHPDQIAVTYDAFPEAVTRVGEIVGQCQPVLPDGRPIWPVLDLPSKQTPDEALARQARAGMKERYGRQPPKRVTARLQKELAAINQHGFAPLFLLVADITRYARETAVPVNTRGSVANSLVAYCVGISKVDPMAHNLLFERFLNPARANMPDIDLDFCSRRRDEILAYVRQKYGQDRVALVATVSTMQPKSAVRETAKAYGMAERDIKKLTALVPRHWHPDPRRREQQTLEDILAQVDDALSRQIITDAFRILGQPHHLSIHPGGIVITPGDLTDIVPVQMAPKGFLITQYDLADLERIGLPKIDLLGIRALTVLADAAELIRRDHDPAFRLEAIDLADEQTAAILSRGHTIGVFQCESTGAQRTLRQLQARTVQDLAVANAFFKPGPATGGMAAAFIRRYRGTETVSFLHPALEPILGRTQGVLLFQEQILRVATEVAGLSWAEADHLRRGMSKFKAREMATLRQRFVRGCQEVSGFTPEQADTLWEQVMPFAGYGFNQGHATAYADVSYRSAYLKTHYTAEFLCARLAGAGGFHHPAIYMAEAQRLGISIRPPHVNFSGRKFTLLQEEIRDWGLEIEGAQSLISNPQSPNLFMGLGQVRDLRRRSVAAIIAEREKALFASLRDLLSRVPLKEKETRHLIQCGALDGLGQSRAALLAEAEWVARGGSAHQMAFDFARETAVSPESPAQRLAWESRILGQPVSANPIQLVKEQTADDVPLRYVHRLLNQKTTIAGVHLPGWTGGKGFFFGDGDDFIIVKSALPGKQFTLWEPVRLSGRFRCDEWETGWFEAESMTLLAAA